MAEVFECEGLKGGKLFHQNDGFFYVKKVEKSPKTMYLTCMKTYCQGTAKLVTDNAVRVFYKLGAHSVGCEPDVKFVETLALRKAIMVRCQKETTPLSIIFREECNRVSSNIAACITFPQILTAMKLARRKGTPTIPETFAQYEEMLVGRFGDNDGTDYTFMKVGVDEDEAVVFIIDPLKNLFKGSNEIHFDGTFKIVPNMPKSRQLLSALAISNDHAFPVAFALMRSRTAAAYRNVFTCFKEKCDGLNPKLIISDFESSIKTSVKEIFPEATHKGCWFHFTQAIFKRVQRSGSLNTYHSNPRMKRAVRMLMCLALLPPHLIEEGFNAVKMSCQDMEEMQGILTYFESQWMNVVGSASFSVYGQPRRTNNVQESFHHVLNGLIGKAHPNVWEFTNALKSVANTAVRDQLRVTTRGAQLTFSRRRRWVLQDSAMQNAQKNLVLGRITPKEFLEQMTHHVTSHVPLQTVHDDVDEDLVPLPGTLRVHTVPSEVQDILGGGDSPVDTESADRGRVRGRGGRNCGLVRARGGRGGVRARGGRGGARARGRNSREELMPTAANAAEDGTGAAGDDPIPNVAPPQSQYAQYRHVPLRTDETDFMSDEEVRHQHMELEEGLQGAGESTVPSTDSLKCVLCLSNRPTRVCLPCGHLTMCRNCLDTFIATESFHSVVMADGSILETHIRLPLTCPLCRAIIGSTLRVLLP